MKVEDDPEVLLRHSQTAFEAASVDVLAEARALAPHVTGQYAASLLLGATTTGERLVIRVGSSLRRGAANELGANVGPRRGPHMRGAHTTVTAVNHFAERMAERLRSTPIR